MQPQVTTVDERIAALAGSAHGVLDHDELRDAGLTVAEIRTRRERGSLLQVFQGVYRVGHAAPSYEATYMAAVKACGKDAVLSGRAAAHLLGLIKGTPPPPEVTAAKKKDIKGIKTKRSILRAEERTKMRGIPVTSPARTLVDLAATLPEHILSRVVHEAAVRYRVTPKEIDQVLTRHPNAPGAAKLRRIASGDSPTLLSELECEFLKLLKKRNLPLPETNREAGGRYVDCRWPAQRLTVELDSYRFHNTRQAWERDRQREREAYARGDQFRRYTYGDVCETPRMMLAELRALIV